MATVPQRIPVPPHAFKNARADDRSRRDAALDWARTYARAQGWPEPRVALESGVWQAHFTVPVDDV